MKLQRAMEQRLGQEGRIVIRPSGTEPVIRVMVEAADRDVMEEVAYSMASCIQKHMAGDRNASAAAKGTGNER
jgi:phosphoglucosamine mutase